MNAQNSRSGLFLLEMIMVILFFSLTAAVYVQLFAAAYRKDNDSRNLTNAVMISQNLAEAFYANGGDQEAMTQLFPEADFGRNPTAWSWDTEGETMYLFFDKDWRIMPRGEADDMEYVARLHIETGRPLQTARVAVSHTREYTGLWGAPFYELTLTRYAPETEDAP